MAESPPPTITTESITTTACPHCGVSTVHVKGGERIGTPDDGLACLQCIADGGACCSLAPLNRWKENPDGK